MATYDYICEACKHEWQEEQKINDPKVDTCPKCAKVKAKRLISGGTSFILKGGGWYREGYSSSK